MLLSLSVLLLAVAAHRVVEPTLAAILLHHPDRLPWPPVVVQFLPAVFLVGLGFGTRILGKWASAEAARLEPELAALQSEIDDLKTERDQSDNWSDAWRHRELAAQRAAYDAREPADLLMLWRQQRRELATTLPRKLQLARKYLKSEDPAQLRELYEAEADECRKRYNLLTGRTVRAEDA